MTASAWFGCAHLLSRGSDGGAAEDGEVSRDWDAVKGRLDLAVAGHRAFAPPFTSLHLQDEVIDDFVMRRLDGDEAELMHWPEFADLENWPADAQLAVHSMAWAMGTRRFDQFTIFRGAAAARDWRMVAEQCRMKPDSGTLRLRNILDRRSPLNAARVDDEGLDPALLVFDLTGLFGVQAALRSIGYDPGPLAGQTGPATRGAIADFQLAIGLASTVEPDADTIEGLAESLDGSTFVGLTT